ncbi:MAG: histidine phosphatase family protein [Gammaproteobacteria bacterium]
MRALLLLRHAKSDWESGADDDFARPLAKRGRKAAERMGAWMRRHELVPGYIVSSSAARARETVQILCGALRLDATPVVYDDRLYLADRDELLGVLRDCPRDAESVMLVGHNPGLEELLMYLCGSDVPVAANGKLLPTAALARITLPDNWRSLKRESGRIIAVTRPKEL